MSTTHEPASFFWPGFADMAEQPRARLQTEGGTYAVIEFGGGVRLHLRTTAQCDALVKAALAARDMLAPAATHCPGCGAAVTPVEGTCPDCPPAAKPLATVCPICGTCLEPSGRCAVCTAVPIGEYPVGHLACGCQVQDVMPIGPGTPMVCERHGGTHVIAAGTGPCPPGTCTCGATVSSAGVVTPAATA